MRLTDEQKHAVHETGHVCLVSCPGSGKTRVIVAKLLRCIEAVQNTPRRVACITHTNAAADEIDSRLRRLCFGQEDKHYEVATIHAFALKNILTPFHHFLPELAGGFTVLTSDADEYIAKASELLRHYNQNGRLAEEFERIMRNPDGSIRPLDSLPLGLQQDWCSWLDANAYVTFSDMVYHAGRLISGYPHISSVLASRFAWILIDEFQDTSLGQILIFENIYQYARTNFFCVGDPNQSIYRFAGATSELLTNFAAHIGANTNHRLSGNFRSSNRIVTLAERLCPTNPAMQSVGAYRDFPLDPAHYRGATQFDAVMNNFIPAVQQLNVPLGEVAILAPWWISLFHLGRQLRAAGFPVIGPGARPYRRTHLIAQILESLGAYVEDGDTDSAVTVQRSLFNLLTGLADRAVHDVFSYKGRIVICRMLAEAQVARIASPIATNWITDVSERICTILAGFEVPESALNAIRQSATAMVLDIGERNLAAALTVADIGIFGRPKDCIQLMTVHKAKGREFEAVAIVDVHDGRFPHFSVRNIRDLNERTAQYDEARRMVYVAATRAKRLLMFFTDTADHRNQPSPFLREMNLV